MVATYLTVTDKRVEMPSNFILNVRHLTPYA